MSSGIQITAISDLDMATEKLLHTVKENVISGLEIGLEVSQ